MANIRFQNTYQLGELYESIKARAIHVLSKYLDYRELISFNDLARSVTFSTERLIPVTSTKRPPVLLLFSNPHPYSVYQGMFLSPNSKGRENLFWPVMEDAGWLPIPEENRNPKQLADICLKANYQGPFELIFYCYYAFPTDYPEDIKTIFGKTYFNQFIEPEAKNEFMKTIQDTPVKAVVSFNRGIYNLVAKDPIESYIELLLKGELIESQIKDINRSIPIFLTFPTGWRYRRQYMQFRKASLDTIRRAICGESKVLESQDP